MAVNITRVGIVEEAFAANKIEAVATPIDKVTIVRNCYSRELTSVEVVD